MPIPSKKVDTGAFAKEIQQKLLSQGFRCTIDDRENYTPGFKYNDWEMRGVPMRIEIGEREVDSGTAVLVSRHDRKKTKVPIGEVAEWTSTILQGVKDTLTERAGKYFGENKHHIGNLDDLAKAEGFVIAGWCGDQECASKIEERYEFGTLGISPDDTEEKKCIVCGKPGRNGTFSRSY